MIYGDREKTYGHPAVNLERIAHLWQAYLVAAIQSKDEFEFSAENVAWMMVLVKMARQMNKSKRDNLIDAAGYIALIERIEDGSKESN